MSPAFVDRWMERLPRLGAQALLGAGAESRVYFSKKFTTSAYSSPWSYPIGPLRKRPLFRNGFFHAECHIGKSQP